MSDTSISLCIAAAFVVAFLLMTAKGRAVLFMLTRPRQFQIWLLLRKRKQASLSAIERFDSERTEYCQHCRNMRTMQQNEFSKTFICLHCGNSIDLERMHK